MQQLNAKDRRRLERVIRQVKREAEREWRATMKQEGKAMAGRMGIGDALLCLFLPPLASGVRARGCGMMLFVLLLTCIFWLPGTIAAFYMQLNPPPSTVP